MYGNFYSMKYRRFLLVFAGPTKTQSIILETKLKTLEHQIYVAILSTCVNSWYNAKNRAFKASLKIAVK